MVNDLRVRGVHDRNVIKAMMTVPRHQFVDKELARFAYGDHPLPISAHQTISQPFIVAEMTENAHINSDSTVLEIG